MKTYDEMTYDEQGRFLDWAEAEYCPKCGGNGMIRQMAHRSPTGVLIENFPAWTYCDRCKGTGRA